MSDVGFILYRRGDERGALAQFERARAIREVLVRADPDDTRARLLLASAISRVGSTRWALGEREPALAAHREALSLFDMLAARMPADVSLQRTRAEELATMGTSYAQMDGGRREGSGCRRARSFLVRALDSYGGLAAKGPLPAEAAARVTDLQATLARCGGDR